MNAYGLSGYVGLTFEWRTVFRFEVCFHGGLGSLRLMPARSGGWRDSTRAEPGTSNTLFKTGHMGRCLLVGIIFLFRGCFNAGFIISFTLSETHDERLEGTPNSPLELRCAQKKRSKKLLTNQFRRVRSTSRECLNLEQRIWS